MDILTQRKLFIRVIIVLVILNISMLVYLAFFNKGAKHRRPGERDNPEEAFRVLSATLELSPQQLEEFKKVRQTFFVQERELISTIRQQRDSMNNEMFNKSADSLLLQGLAKRISDNIYKMEQIRIQQATELRSKCTAQQLEKFEQLVIEIRDYLKPEDKPKY